MGSGGVAIAALPTVICLKVSFSDGLGGVISNLITFVIFITLSYLIALGIEQLKKLTAKNHG